MKKTCLTVAALFAISPAVAQETKAIPLEQGQTILSISASEETDIKQDVLQATLRMEVENKDVKKVQEDINKNMKKALELANAESAVKSSTGHYNVYSYDPNPTPTPAQKDAKQARERMIWKGSQTIELEGKDQAKLLELAGKIQDLGFAMSGMSYTLSTEQSEGVRDDLMTAALKKIQVKADKAAKALGKSSFDIVEVNVDGSGPIHPMPVMYSSARMQKASMDTEMASAPVAQAAQQTVTLSVNARVVLKP